MKYLQFSLQDYYVQICYEIRRPPCLCVASSFIREFSFYLAWFCGLYLYSGRLAASSDPQSPLASDVPSVLVTNAAMFHICYLWG